MTEQRIFHLRFSQDDLKDALAILEENKEPLTIKNITHNEGVAKVSIVGAGMMTNPGVASKLFEALLITE